MAKEINFLKERSKEFWNEGVRLYKEGKYNLSVFNIEQAIQLWIKYLIGIKITDWPKTHYFSELIKSLSDVYEKKGIIEYYKKNEIFFNNLEDAYFTTRYFPKNFSKNIANQFIENAKKFILFTENLTGEKFFNE
ncbi:MAG TPA: HEPN domain-containing protein [bacterium]|nr:HEPN domain-containing protein [bacterium]HOM26160.1 HEPN domain-containing protein [bacterium]